MDESKVRELIAKSFDALAFAAKELGFKPNQITSTEVRLAKAAYAAGRAAAPGSLSEELTFKGFSAINRQRCESPTGFNHQLASWSTSDWFLAVLGELGEAANIAKKLNRVRDGIPGNKLRAEELQIKLRQELGDTFVYLDLLCQAVGVAIGEAAVEVFNAKSQELGCEIVWPAPSEKGIAAEGGRE